MPNPSRGLVIRQQAWFRPLLEIEKISPFPADKIDLVYPKPVSTFRTRVLLGRGPVEHELLPEFFPWFEHGECGYPTFVCPSIGPTGAALKMSRTQRRLNIAADEALALIEISLVQPVDDSFIKTYNETQNSQLPGRHVADGPTETVHQWLTRAKKLVEQAIGIYALYQFPVVWEQLGIHPLVAFVDFGSNTFRTSTPIEFDNFVPFRLNPALKLQDGLLTDEALTDFTLLVDDSLHFPLLLLQRALWQKNVQLRFLETFLLLDYLASQAAVEDPDRLARERLYKLIDEFIRNNHPEYQDRVMALKHVVLQRSTRQRIDSYLQHLGINLDEATLRKMLRIRNDLAHARPVDHNLLTEVELTVRQLARDVMRHALATKGITLDRSLTAA